MLKARSSTCVVGSVNYGRPQDDLKMCACFLYLLASRQPLALQISPLSMSNNSQVNLYKINLQTHYKYCTTGLNINKLDLVA